MKINVEYSGLTEDFKFFKKNYTITEINDKTNILTFSNDKKMTFLVFNKLVDSKQMTLISIEP